MNIIPPNPELVPVLLVNGTLNNGIPFDFAVRIRGRETRPADDVAVVTPTTPREADLGFLTI